jgi:hypothetical protein
MIWAAVAFHAESNDNSATSIRETDLGHIYAERSTAR